jgi:ABC-2 type transport system permease protein
MVAVFRRELHAFFISPIAYVFIAVFLAISGYYFWGYQLYSGSSDFSNMFTAIFSIVLFLSPLLTMRVFSEERRNKTDQALITAPVSLTAIVTGKYFATVLVFLAGQMIMLAYLWIIAANTTVEYAVFFGSFIGLLLVGMALSSIGIFVSALTESQIIAAVGALAINVVLFFVNSITYITSNTVVAAICKNIAFYARYKNFTTGILDPADLVFFISVIVLFNFLTVRTLEKRRWS